MKQCNISIIYPAIKQILKNMHYFYQFFKACTSECLKQMFKVDILRSLKIPNKQGNCIRYKIIIQLLLIHNNIFKVEHQFYENLFFKQFGSPIRNLNDNLFRCGTKIRHSNNKSIQINLRNKRSRNDQTFYIYVQIVRTSKVFTSLTFF